MYMTHDEATTTWCPFAREVRFEPTGAASFNRTSDPHKFNEDLCCLGEECAAWRREPGERLEARLRAREQDGRSIDNVTRQGYCGLAGKPED